MVFVKPEQKPDSLMFQEIQRRYKSRETQANISRFQITFTFKGETRTSLLHLLLCQECKNLGDK